MVQADMYKDKILAKLNNICKPGYIKYGPVVRLKSFSEVPKGELDI
jgi:hypothetical protein